MNFLPKASRTRPLVACEVAPGGVIAARAGEVAGSVAAVGSAELSVGALAPGLRPGNVVDRLAVVAAIRNALEAVGAKPNSRSADITLVIPDGACRVMLLDFDALPNKLTEALPLVRFRLKKLVPFDSDTAMVSFQVMSQSKQLVRVLAVCVPSDVLAEYETAAREAGFEPGAILPSTLAALAGVASEGASLVINAGPLGVTTAISRDGILLLHRTIDLQAEPAGIPANLPPALFEPSVDARGVAEFARLPLVSEEDTRAEWAAQEPLPEFGHDPYADHIRAEEAAQNFDSITDLRVPAAALVEKPAVYREPGAVQDSPYAQPTVLADLTSELHNAVLMAPTSPGTFTEPAAGHQPLHMDRPAPDVHAHEAEPLPADEFAHEVAQAVSVAAAYFEDTLSSVPDAVLASGSLTHSALQRLLRDAEVTELDDLRVRDIVPVDALAADATSSRVSRSRLGPVWGALCG